jgi:hypothetical protein
MARRHPQVHRTLHHHRARRGNQHRLRIDQHRRHVDATDVDAAVEARLADADGHPDVGPGKRRGGQRGGGQDKAKWFQHAHLGGDMQVPTPRNRCRCTAPGAQV